MYSGNNILYINPFNLEDNVTRHGFTVSGVATVPVNTEVVIISFTTLSYGVTLKNLVHTDPWNGSSSAYIFIRQNKGTLGDYFNVMQLDIPSCLLSRRIHAYIPPRTLCEVSMLNLTDTGNDRTPTLTLTGYYGKDDA